MNFYSLLYLNKSAAFLKIKGAILVSAFAAPLALTDLVREWVNINGGYIGFVLLAIMFDWALGFYVHLLVKRDFSLKKSISGIFVKTGLVFTVGIMFEGLHYIYAQESTVKEYLETVTRLMVFLYPAGSFFLNCSFITGGKFPPLGLLKTISRFNTNININDLKPGQNENDNRERGNYGNDENGGGEKGRY